MINIKKNYRVKENVKHQNIGGKIFYPEFILTPDEVDEKAVMGNMACLNFALRRDDFLPKFDKELIYGKIKKDDIYFGYVLCEDELEEI